jgi:hypothetical protein
MEDLPRESLHVTFKTWNMWYVRDRIVPVGDDESIEVLLPPMVNLSNRIVPAQCELPARMA